MMEHRDILDYWLFHNIGVLPGCCASQESLKYSIARETAERLMDEIFHGTADAMQESDTGLINVTVKVSPYMAPAILTDDFTQKVFTDNIIKALRREYEVISDEGGGASNLSTHIAQDHAPNFAPARSDFEGQNPKQ